MDKDKLSADLSVLRVPFVKEQDVTESRGKERCIQTTGPPNHLPNHQDKVPLIVGWG